MTSSSEAVRILGILSDPDRLRVAAAIVLGKSSVAEIEAATGMERRAIERCIARLASAGLLAKGTQAGYRFEVDELRVAVQAAAKEQEATDSLGHAPNASNVLRRFVRDGRLLAIPTTRSKRLVVLDWIVQEFEPGFRYTEKDVNETLGEYHEDTAALRRYLVDEGFMERESGEYWRAGGTFAID